MPSLKIKHKGEIGYRISDIGAGGKEYNIKDFGYTSRMKLASKMKKVY
jgi:hypothetical protein